MTELAITTDDGRAFKALLALPQSGSTRAALVPLHPSNDASREQFLFQQLADLLPARGIAVARFDRRPATGDVPLERQAADAHAVIRALHAVPALDHVPAGLWGFSQGAWAAALAAAHSPKVRFLVLVAAVGVTPAAQMRYGTALHLREAGFDASALAELDELRATYEEYLRGNVERSSAERIVRRFAERPWFPLAWVPSELPPPGAWRDMDFDPEPIFARVRCPVLLFYGEDDEWAPVDASITAWRRAAAAASNHEITIVRLPETRHHPTLGGGRTIASISPLYTQRLLGWLERFCAGRETRPHG